MDGSNGLEGAPPGWSPTQEIGWSSIEDILQLATEIQSGRVVNIREMSHEIGRSTSEPER